MVENINHDGRLFAIIIKSGFSKHGIHFFTPDDFSQQLAFMQHPAGKIIEPHIHNPVPRNVQYTQEVLIIKKGRLKVSFYDEKQRCFDSRILESGDVILLAEGGHGFEALEELEMIEVKQGPYAGGHDKTRFIPQVDPL